MEAVAVPVRIDARNAVEVLDALRATAAAAGPTPPALDLAPLAEFDSSALALLLQLVREREGPVPFLLNPPRKLQVLADLYGVAEMLFGAPAVQPDATASSS